MTLRPFETYRRVFLPYCLHLVTPAVRSQDQRWVILNRFYKPLGIGTYNVDEMHPPRACLVDASPLLR